MKRPPLTIVERMRYWAAHWLRRLAARLEPTPVYVPTVRLSGDLSQFDAAMKEARDATRRLR